MTSPSMEMQSTELGSLLEALSKAQGEIKGALEDCANPFFKSTYADLTSVWEACREPLAKNGLSVLQTTQILDGMTCLVSTLGHKSGQWIRGILPIKTPILEKKDKHGNITHIVKDDLQSLGSAITYSRRYALSALVGVCPVDDDGERAMDRNKKKDKESSQAESKPAVIFRLPEGIDENVLNIFIEESAKTSKCSVAAVKKRAAENMEGFLEVFKKWQKQYFNTLGEVGAEDTETA